MVLPQEVKFGEPFQARVVAWSHKDTQGRISLFRNGEFLGSQVVRLSAGKNVFSYRQSLDQSGIHVYQAAIEVDGDTIEDNNRAVGTVVVRGRPQVLLADKDKGHAASLAGALRSQNIEVTVVEPAGVPRDMAGLQKYDGVILSNVSSLKLTRDQMVSIRDYVRDSGGGLLMVGGEESFGLGGYYRTPIEEALPVTMEVKQKIEIPSLAVVLSIDRSGSMAMSTDEKVTKLDLAKEAAHLVIDLLDERNEVGVMSWDTEFIWDFPVKTARDRAAAHHAVATIKAGGGTDGYPALKEAYAVLFDRPALLKHVIFLSDGQMTRGDFAGLLRRMSKDKITISTVAIGKDADVQLMVDIAKWGRGRFYYTEDSQTIPRIFTLETQLASKASLVEQPFKPTLTAPAHEAMQDIDWKAVPPLGGYVATSGEGHGGTGADEPPGGSRAGHLALRTRSIGRVHLRRQGQVGAAVAALAGLQQVLGSAHAMDPAQRDPQRYPGHRRASGRGRGGGGRRRGRQRGVHQLPRFPGRRRGPQPRADGHRPRADRAGAISGPVSRSPGRGVPGGNGPAAKRPGGGIAARGPGGTVRTGASRPGGR